MTSSTPQPIALHAVHFVRDSPTMKNMCIGENDEGQRLDNFLIRQLKGVPKTHIYRIIRSGEVRINKGRAQADCRLILGDVVRVPPVRTSHTNELAIFSNS